MASFGIFSRTYAEDGIAVSFSRERQEGDTHLWPNHVVVENDTRDKEMSGPRGVEQAFLAEPGDLQMKP
jgi:hypothetical protein